MSEAKAAATAWDLEEIPYKTNDPAGGWYLHMGPYTDDVLYLSRAHVSEPNARLIAKAPELLAALQAFIALAVTATAVGNTCVADTMVANLMIDEARALLAEIEGKA